MSSQSHGAFYKTALAQVNERLQKLAADLKAAVTARDDAQALVDTITKDMSELTAVRSELEKNVLSTSRKRAQEIVQDLPEDVIRLILLELSALSRRVVPGCDFRAECGTTTQWNVAYTVATVCSRWRIVALDTAALWIDVRAFGNKLDAAAALNALDRLETTLWRAKSLPLDISLRVEGHTDLLDNMVTKLGAQATRWRSVSLVFSEDSAKALDILQFPTPLLQEVYVSRLPSLLGIYPSQLVNYLPHSPILKRFLSDTHTAGWGLQRLENLVSVQMTISAHHFTTLRTMLMLAPNIECLDITMHNWHDQSWIAPSQAEILRLPVLHRLTLRCEASSLFTTWGAFTDFPSLTTLELMHSSLSTRQYLCQRFAASVTTLKLCLEELYDGEVAVAKTLTELRHLEVSRQEARLDVGPMEEDPDVAINPYAFVYVLNEDAWPSLETIHFSHSVFANGSAEALVELVKHRNSNSDTAHEGVSEGQNRVSQLKSITFDSTTCDVPLWIRDQISFFLQNKEE